MLLFYTTLFPKFSCPVPLFSSPSAYTHILFLYPVSPSYCRAFSHSSRREPTPKILFKSPFFKIIFLIVFFCRSQNRTPRYDDENPRSTPQYDERSSSRASRDNYSAAGKSPRSARSSPRTNTSPRSMTMGDSTPLYDEN